MTPPSRSSAAGSSAMRRRSSVAIASGGASASREHRRAAARPRRRQRGAHLRQRLQRRAQAGELARPHLAQRDARGDPLDVGEVAQRVAQRARGPPSSSAAIASWRWLATRRSRSGCVSQWRSARLPMPVAQGSSSREQRRRVLAAQRLRQLEVAMRRRRQVDQLARALHRQALHVGERPALRVLGVARAAPPAAACARRQVLGAEAGERGDAQLRAELALPSAASNCHVGRRVIVVAPAARRCPRAGRGRPAPRPARAARASRRARRRCIRPGRSRRSTARSRRGRSCFAPRRDREQQRIALVGEQVALGQRARRDDAHDLALDRPLGRADLADLLADRHRFAELDQLGEIGLDRVHRHAGHRDRLRRRSRRARSA